MLPLDCYSICHMKLFSNQNRNRHPVVLYGLTLLLISILGSSCQSNFSSMSETVVSRSAKKLREAATPPENISRTENIVLLGRSAALFYLDLAEGFPKEASEDLAAFLNRRVAELPFYQPVRKIGDFDTFFKNNRYLNELKDTYLESLARVSVSNKDISNRIGRELKVDNLIAFHIDRWPCAECSTPLRIRLKLRVIDLASGMIIWTGINELQVNQPTDGTYDQLQKLSQELLDQLQKRFERKWHRKRFQNLALLARE